MQIPTVIQRLGSLVLIAQLGGCAMLGGVDGTNARAGSRAPSDGAQLAGFPGEAEQGGSVATLGLNHLGLAVRDLESTRDFFVEQLGWTESGYDPGYPRTAVSDGKLRLTLWQVDHSQPVSAFDRRQNVGLHHLALEVASEGELNALAEKLSRVENVRIEFLPELLGGGPRKHFMCYEPGGIRVEFIWPAGQ